MQGPLERPRIEFLTVALWVLRAVVTMVALPNAFPGLTDGTFRKDVGCGAASAAAGACAQTPPASPAQDLSQAAVRQGCRPCRAMPPQALWWR